MRLMPRDRFSLYRLAWLLALVLLLPLAQAAANCHLLSHVRTDQSEQSDRHHALHVSQCNLCLTAVALTGGALPVQSIALAPVVKPAEAPRSQSSAVRFVRLQRLYESRAPPFALI